MLSWDTLLSAKRYSHPLDPDPTRSEFHRDYDRIVFSTAFRRLGRKTQVHPFSINDHVHSRLTHSIEVSSVGRSLAMTVFQRIRDALPRHFSEHHFGTIVQSACLAHDIGNPPFGHAGEAAIRDWFRKNRDTEPFAKVSDRDMSDFCNFDGNAQGFRILSALEYHFLDGGMRLTAATLGSMIKYPRLATYGTPTSVFNSEADLFRETCGVLGLPEISDGKWVRHPLSYLVEAADDICYAILDLEDAIELGILSFGDVQGVFAHLCNQDVNVAAEYQANQNNFRDFLSSIRGFAIQNLIQDIADLFTDHYDAIMRGELPKSLLAMGNTDPIVGIRQAKKIGEERIYPDRRKTELEVGSYTTISTVLEAFISGVHEFQVSGPKTYRADRIMRLIGRAKIGQSVNPAEAYHQVLDFVAGMTDNYATYLARQIGGLAS